MRKELSNSRIVDGFTKASISERPTVIFCHGFRNDASSQGRLTCIRKHFQSRGFSTLGFDFTGVNPESDEVACTRTWKKDLDHAIEFLKSEGVEKVILFGFSLGGYHALAHRSEMVTHKILLGPLSGPMKYEWEKHLTEDVLASLRSKNLALVWNGDRSSRIQLSSESLEDFEKVDQDELISGLAVPALFIHGDPTVDDEESALLNHSKELISKSVVGCDLVVIAGADHSFHNHLSQVMEEIDHWLQSQGIDLK